MKEIARAIDLDTLYSLSSTCRQFHANLEPYRHQLVKETLRCENEYIETLADMLHGNTILPESVKSVIQLIGRESGQPARLTRGKVGKCARDMVGECRRCAKVVCRVREALKSRRMFVSNESTELHYQTSLSSRP